MIGEDIGLGGDRHERAVCSGETLAGGKGIIVWIWECYLERGLDCSLG